MGHIQRHHLSEALAVIPEGEILTVADQVIGPLFERHITNDLENHKLATVRNFLLPRLMSGEVRLKDAENQIGEVS
jgi:type I restriction enzyme S subunit